LLDGPKFDIYSSFHVVFVNFVSSFTVNVNLQAAVIVIIKTKKWIIKDIKLSNHEQNTQNWKCPIYTLYGG